jgi:hypothetical protein
MVMLLAIGAATTSCNGAVSKSPPPHPAAPLPELRPARVVWQAPVGANPVITGDVIVAAERAGVAAFDAHTGKRRWTTTDPSVSSYLNHVVAGSAVEVVLGHDLSRAPAAVYPVATVLEGLDLGTGRRLWTHPLSGRVQQPGLAAAGDLVAIADADGTVQGLDGRTGRSQWRVGTPADCPVPDTNGPDANASLSGERAALVVQRRCVPGEKALVQGVDPATGQVRWSWPSPGDPKNQGDIAELSMPAGTGVAVARTARAETVPPRIPTQQWTVPGTDSADAEQTQVAILDVSGGKLLWREVGSPADTFRPGGNGLICLIGGRGYECRRAVDGRLVFSTAAPSGTGPFLADNQEPAIADGVAYELHPVGDHEELVSRSVATGATLTRTRVPVSSHSVPGSNYQSVITAAGAGLVFVRRADVVGFPLLAIVSPVQPASATR